MASNLRIALGAGGAAMLLALLHAAPARAAGDADDAVTEDRLVTAAAEPGRFLPGAVVPESGDARASGLGWGGYDGGTHNLVGGAGAEARLGSRVVLGVGATYAPGNDLHGAGVRPSVTLRAQLLDQGRHGVDGGVALSYRADRFVGEEGFFQGTIALGARSAAGTVLANLAYGMDGEGDDREGELRLAGLHRVGANLHVGVDGRVRRSLGSTDPLRIAHGTPSLAYSIGPVVSYGIGPLALTLQAGLSGARIQHLENGALALGGVGGVF
jgi:hypothetical protein